MNFFISTVFESILTASMPLQSTSLSLSFLSGEVIKLAFLKLNLSFNSGKRVFLTKIEWEGAN